MKVVEVALVFAFDADETSKEDAEEAVLGIGNDWVFSKFEYQVCIVKEPVVDMKYDKWPEQTERSS